MVSQALERMISDNRLHKFPVLFVNALTEHFWRIAVYNHWLFWGQRCNNYQTFIVSFFFYEKSCAWLDYAMSLREFSQWRHYRSFLAKIWNSADSLTTDVRFSANNQLTVTYELTYHHFPNPILSVGKSVLSSTFSLYPWLTSLILYRMVEKNDRAWDLKQERKQFIHWHLFSFSLSILKQIFELLYLILVPLWMYERGLRKIECVIFCTHHYTWWERQKCV